MATAGLGDPVQGRRLVIAVVIVICRLLDGSLVSFAPLLPSTSVMAQL